MDPTISKVLLRLAAQERGISIQPLVPLSEGPAAAVEHRAPEAVSNVGIACSNDTADQPSFRPLTADTPGTASTTGAGPTAAACDSAVQDQGHSQPEAAAEAEVAAEAAPETGTAAGALSAAENAGLLDWEAEQVLAQPLGYVCLLGVAPDCRRLGLGQALLDNALRFSRSYG